MWNFDWIAGGIAVITFGVWIIRLESRISGHDTLFAEREKQALDRHEDTKERLVRIETKLDGMNGHSRVSA